MLVKGRGRVVVVHCGGMRDGTVFEGLIDKYGRSTWGGDGGALRADNVQWMDKCRLCLEMIKATRWECQHDLGSVIYRGCTGKRHRKEGGQCRRGELHDRCVAVKKQVSLALQGESR